MQNKVIFCWLYSTGNINYAIGPHGQLFYFDWYTNTVTWSACYVHCTAWTINIVTKICSNLVCMRACVVIFVQIGAENFSEMWVHISLLRCKRACAHPHVHFSLEKMCGCLCTLGFLAEISFTPLLYHPGGCLGCPEKGTRSRNNNLFVKSAVFQSKWNDVQKTYKNHQNPVKSYCFLGYFQSWFNFGWKTAAQTN